MRDNGEWMGEIIGKGRDGRETSRDNGEGMGERHREIMGKGLERVIRGREGERHQSMIGKRVGSGRDSNNGRVCVCTQLNMGVSLSFTSRLAYFYMPSEITQN